MANPSLQIGNDNWAIKEDNLLGYSTAGTRFVPQPMTMTRASLGTRVNSNGLVEDVELLGSELVTNGDFSTDSDWNLESTWTIENGVANGNGANGSSQELTQANSFTLGKTYKVIYEILNYVSGSIRFQLAGGATLSGTTRSADGTYTEYVVATANHTLLKFKSDNSFYGSIDNVSVKEATIENLARVDYTDGTSSLLVEPQRTNLITYSEKLSSTTNVTSSNTISPDGTLNGLKLNETTGNSQHYSTSYGASVVSGGTIYTVSFYIKKGTYDLVKVYTQSSRMSATIDITFSTESISTGGGDMVSGSGFMEDVGNGWYRVGFSATANSTGEVSIYLSPKDLSTYVGDISQYTEYWGMQIEQGSYPTSYIKTSGSTVTRNQETYTKTGISDLINSEEGVLFVEFESLVDSNFSFISINNGAAAQNIAIGRLNGSSNIYVLANNVSNQFYYNSSASSNTTNNNKIALKYKENDYALWINGTEVYTDTSASVPVGLDTLSFDYGGGLHTFNGKVKQLQVFKTALSDSELATLTT